MARVSFSHRGRARRCMRMRASGAPMSRIFIIISYYIGVPLAVPLLVPLAVSFAVSLPCR